MAVGATAALLAALAVAVAATGAPEGTPAQASTSASIAAAPPVPSLTWKSCDGDFQCATARVPLDYQHPGGTMISIALIRHLAADPAHRLGSLFVDGGGPTVQVDNFADEIYPAVPAELQQRYDIVTFDPRGFGHSTALRCFSSQAAENAFFANVPPFPVGVTQQAAWERTYAQFDAQCAARNGSLLDHDTSADVARDLDLLRQAVGDPMLNYLGLSYATGLGAIYANLFPSTVGHMVLDGNLPPKIWSSTDGALPEFVREGGDEAAATVMDDFLTRCGQASTSSCAFSAGSPAATRAKWNTLLRRLLKAPVTAGGQTVTYADLIVSTPQPQSFWAQAAVEFQQYWIASGGGTAAATGGGPTAAAQGSPGSVAGSGPATLPPAYTGLEQLYGEVCTDTSNPRDPTAYPALAQQAASRSGGYGMYQTWLDEPCAQWPGNGIADRYPGPWNRPTANTILVFGNTGDPVTPYQDSVAMAHDLANARLLTIDEAGHTEGMNPTTCAMNYEVSYLATGALPPAGTVCPADAPPFRG